MTVKPIKLIGFYALSSFSWSNCNWIQWMMIDRLKGDRLCAHRPCCYPPIHRFIIRFFRSLLRFHSFHALKANDSNSQKMMKTAISHPTAMFDSCFFTLRFADVLRVFDINLGTNNQIQWQWFTEFTVLFLPISTSITILTLFRQTAPSKYTKKSVRQISRHKTIVNAKPRRLCDGGGESGERDSDRTDARPNRG